MNKQIVCKIAFFFSLCLLVFSACNDDDNHNPDKPVIDLTEIGHENSKTGVAGSDLHLEGGILADGVIRRIDIEINPQNGESFKIEKSYTEGKYIGVKNTDFHEHLDIPAETPAGAYRLRFAVTDEWGQVTIVETGLTIESIPVNITIEGLTFGAGHDFPDNRTGYIGTAPVIEAVSIRAGNGIDRILVEIHSEGETAPFEMDTIYRYNGETELTDFHKHLSIPGNTPEGDYHFHFKVYDQSGKSLEESMDIEIQETGIVVSDLKIGDNHAAEASDIHTGFSVNATDPISFIRIRIYQADTPSVYFYNHTFSDEFAAGDVKEYTFRQHLDAAGATPGEYVAELRVNDRKGAYLVLKELVTIVAE